MDKDKHGRSKKKTCERDLIHERNSNKNSSSLQSKPGKDEITQKYLSETAFTKIHNEKPNKTKIQKKPHPTKNAISSKIKTHKQLRRNNRVTKQYDKSCLKKVSLANKFAMETESVKKRCQLLAQKTKELIQNNKRNPEIFINENVQHTRSHFITNNKNIAIHKRVNEIIIQEYIPLPPKLNIGIQDTNKQNKKSFKSNYDLLQTILSSQESERDKQRGKMNSLNDYFPAMVEAESCKPINKESHKTYPFQPVTRDRNRIPLFRYLDDPTIYQSETPGHNLRPSVRETDNPTPFQAVTPEYHFTESGDRSSFYPETHDRNLMHLVRKSDDIPPIQAEKLYSNISPCLVRDSDDASPFQAVTFQSHNYFDQDLRTKSDVEIYNFYKKSRNFITTQSRENFINQTNFPKNNSERKNKLNVYSKLFRLNNHRRNLNKSVKMFNMDNNTVKGIRESYSIEFTENNEYDTSIKNNGSKHDILYSANNITCGVTPSMSCIPNDPHFECVSPMNPKTWFISNDNNNDLDYEPININTFTITNSYSNSNKQVSSNHENWKNLGTYTIESRKSLCESETSNMIKETEHNEISNTNFEFVSKSQENIDERLIMNPIEVCETVLQDLKLSINRLNEFDTSFNGGRDSCSRLNFNINDANGMGDLQSELNNTMSTHFPKIVFNEKTQNQEFEEVSHHFTITNSMLSGLIQNPILSKGNDEKTTEKEAMIVVDTVNDKNDMGAFEIQNRLFFVPKGNTYLHR